MEKLETALDNLITQAIDDGVPTEDIISALELAKYKLQEGDD